MYYLYKKVCTKILMKCAFFLLNKQVNKQEALRYKLKQKNPYTYVKTSTCIQLIKEKEKKNISEIHETTTKKIVMYGHSYT